MILESRQLRKRYRQRMVVDGVSISVKQGEIVGLLGPNGAGKTTTFYMTVGLIKPLDGQVLIDGEDITVWPMYQRARKGVGYLSQEPSIFRRLTVEENLAAIAEMLPISEAEKKEKVERFLEELSLTHLRKQLSVTLSGGESGAAR